MKLIDLTRTIEDSLSVYPGDSHTSLIESSQLEQEGYSNHQLTINCILILHTGYGRLFGEERYYNEHPALTTAFAQLLVRKRIKMLCLDMPSPDHFPFEVHKILLEHHIWIAENLANVDRLLEVSSFQVIALPMKIKADSSIARIIAYVNDKEY